METRQAYDLWSEQYDTNHNKTRDLEAKALRETLGDISFTDCLEIGCGTGKNTEWLMKRAKVTAVDLSAKMLKKAQQKIQADNVQFVQADITGTWAFVTHSYKLISFSLVLEHIEYIDDIFAKAAKSLISGGYIYVGELHPFRQYAGTKARFDTENGRQVLTCFKHRLSDFVQAAANNGLHLETLQEFFDDEDRKSLPRILTLLFKAKF